MEWYINFPEAQKLLGKLRKGKAIKMVRLVNELLKYKQSQVYVPQGKLRLWGFMENMIVPLAAAKEKTHRVVLRR